MTRLCRACGHPRSEHRHHRPGDDCGRCGCPAWRWRPWPLRVLVYRVVGRRTFHARWCRWPGKQIFGCQFQAGMLMIAIRWRPPVLVTGRRSA